jgi:hypothetical protein
MLRVTDARHVRDYVVWLRFSDGTDGEVDLRDELHGEVFEPLRDKKLFRAVTLHPEWHTITWPMEPIWHRSFCTLRWHG